MTAYISKRLSIKGFERTVHINPNSRNARFMATVGGRLKCIRGTVNDAHTEFTPMPEDKTFFEAYKPVRKSSKSDGIVKINKEFVAQYRKSVQAIPKVNIRIGEDVRKVSRSSKCSGSYAYKGKTYRIRFDDWSTTVLAIEKPDGGHSVEVVQSVPVAF